MSQSTKQPPSKRAQKAAKKEQKMKEAPPKREERAEFSRLEPLRTVVVAELPGQLVRNKKVGEYVEGLKEEWEKGSVCVVGVDTHIPKAISVVEALKGWLGVYDERATKVVCSCELAQDQDGSGVMILRVSQ